MAQLKEAALYVKREDMVLAMLLMGALPSLLLLPFVHGLMPVYAGEVFRVGPVGLGLLMSAPGVGSLVGAVTVASTGEMRHRGRVVVLALALTVASMLAFSRSGSMVVSLAILMVLSGSLTTFFTVSGATVQSIVPDNLRGRVSALGSLVFGVYPLGVLAAGAFAEMFGAPTSTVIAGFAFALVLVPLYPMLRRVWRFG